MYNKVTEEKIKNIPSIVDLDVERLPQELTRIYAQIVSLRRKITNGELNFMDDSLISSYKLLKKLANNLETLLLTSPNHHQKESIAFVAGTANNLIHKMELDNGNENLLGVDTVSSYIASIILFLIGNSQSDAAEISKSIKDKEVENIIHEKLISSITLLANGKLKSILEIDFNEEDVYLVSDIQEIAVNLLWRELGLGVINLAKSLLGQIVEDKSDRFALVKDLSVDIQESNHQKSIFSGPYRLAKLLKLLSEDIFNKSVINVPAPINVEKESWNAFLSKLSEDRPYLWENHKEAINSRFLDSGISSILTLPTGAGKSTLSELKIASCIYSGKKVVYIVPTHALEDQVNRNLINLFSEYTFDIIDIEDLSVENFDVSPISVMTPEKCLTFLNIDPNFFNEVGLIVFDEFHIIHGTDIRKDRRSFDSMFCLLSLFDIAPNADYLLISAMVENGDEISEWISKVTNRECKIFKSSWKPTRQLHGCLIFEENKISELNRHIRRALSVSKRQSPSAKLRKELLIEAQCLYSLKNIWETEDNNDYFRSSILEDNVLLNVNNFGKLTSNRNNIAANLAVHFSKLGMKTLVFVDNPKITNSTKKNISSKLSDINNDYDGFIEKNQSIIEMITLELGDIKYSYFNNSENVAVHHGLLLPVERTLIEDYFKYEFGTNVLVATATLAQGINLPAEIVIIAGDDRFDIDTDSRQRVSPHELLNAAGRAGRAGLSSQGAVILIPGEIVTINNDIISDRWWDLKEQVFSKGDQCLRIEDPLEYFLDGIQVSGENLSLDQINHLYRFKPEKLSDRDTKDLLKKSFYAFKSSENDNYDKFESQVKFLLDKRNELDDLSDEFQWQKEIGVKLGIEPSIICKLDDAIEELGIWEMFDYSIIDFIKWFINWIATDEEYLLKIFTKRSLIEATKKVIGLKPNSTIEEVLSKLNMLSDLLESYVSGDPLSILNYKITGKENSLFLEESRYFINRLIPELSFIFITLSMVLEERFKQISVPQDEIPWEIRALSSCVREGVDTPSKLFYKRERGLIMRVQTHIRYQEEFESF